MMLKVADADQLVFQFRDLIPEESTFWIADIHRIDCTVDCAVANVPIRQHFFLRIRLSSLWGTIRQLTDFRPVRRTFQVVHELDSSLVTFPWTKGVRIRLEIKMGVVQRVVCDPPK